MKTEGGKAARLNEQIKTGGRRKKERERERERIKTERERERERENKCTLH